MTFYICAIILTILLMLTMMVHVGKYSGFTKEQKRWYIVIFISVIYCAAAELFALYFDDRGPAFILPITIITVIEFALTPLLPVFFAGALGMERLAKGMRYYGLINILCELVCVPFGWIFYLNENGKYVRGPYYILYEAFFTISLVFLVVSMIIAGRRFKHRDMSTIIMILAIMVAGILPMVFFRIYTDYMAIGVCSILCYIYYNDLVQQDSQAELVENQKRISQMQSHIISGMAAIIESRDIGPGEHLSRFESLVETLSRNAKKDGVYKDALSEHFITLLSAVSPIHDIGKIVVTDQILKKPGKLTEAEFEQVKAHTTEADMVVRKALEGITDEEYLSIASDLATYHHEWWNGKGYPYGLKGEDIPLSARIVAIADVFEALVSDRYYRPAMSADEAFRMIESESGTHFDPQLVSVFLRHRQEIEKVI